MKRTLTVSKKRNKKDGHPRILTEEDKKVILEYVDENPSTILKQLTERLLQKFEKLESRRAFS